MKLTRRIPIHDAPHNIEEIIASQQGALHQWKQGVTGDLLAFKARVGDEAWFATPEAERALLDRLHEVGPREFLREMNCIYQRLRRPTTDAAGSMRIRDLLIIMFWVYPSPALNASVLFPTSTGSYKAAPVPLEHRLRSVAFCDDSTGAAVVAFLGEKYELDDNKCDLSPEAYREIRRCYKLLPARPSIYHRFRIDNADLPVFSREPWAV